MKKLKQSGFTAPEVALIFVLFIALGLTGYYVWHQKSQQYTSVKSPTTHSATTTHGCSQPAPSVKVDDSIASAGKAAFVTQGFSSKWINQHIQLVASRTDNGYGPKGPELDTTLTYRICVDTDKVVSLTYESTSTSKSLSLPPPSYAPVHDINHVISLKQAEQNLVKCGGVLDKPATDSLSFTDIEDSGTPFTHQTRLYLIGSIPINSKTSGTVDPGTSIKSGTTPPTPSKSEITQKANVDLETGKCVVSTITVHAPAV